MTTLLGRLRRPCVVLAGLVLATSGVTGTGSPAAAASTSLTLTSGRTYLLHPGVRASSATPQPLVIVLHPLGGSAAYFATTSGWSGFADNHGGFTVAYGQALKAPGTTYSGTHPTAWNSGGCCQYQNADDVTYINEVLADVKNRVAVDAARVYITGFSNGGMMAARMECEEPGVFAAAGITGSVIDPLRKDQTIPEYSCLTPVRLRHLHGINDGTVPTAGSTYGSKWRPGKFPPAATEVPGSPNAVTAPTSVVSQKLDLPCGHVYPTSANACGYAATADFWNFFLQYSEPQG